MLFFTGDGKCASRVFYMSVVRMPPVDPEGPRLVIFKTPIMAVRALMLTSTHGQA